MDGNKLLPNTLSFDQSGDLDPPIFELLVKVTDNQGTPAFSTTATIIVRVISCITTVPTTTTTTTVKGYTILTSPLGNLNHWRFHIWLYPHF